MFGASKKGKEPIKSITLATAAAKRVSCTGHSDRDSTELDSTTATRGGGEEGDTAEGDGAQTTTGSATEG